MGSRELAAFPAGEEPPKSIRALAEQIVIGHSDLQVAQSRRSHGLLRVPFLEVEGCRKIVTVYWTSQTGRYWRPDANRI